MGNRTTDRPAMPPGAGFNARGKLNRIESSQISFDHRASIALRRAQPGPEAPRLWPGRGAGRPVRSCRAE
eukprot:76193-Hanusia_phi.AAC.1